MKRREFLKMLCATGLSVPFSRMLLQSAAAAEQPYAGDLLLFIHAIGGWDPVQFCDPKGDLDRGFGKDDVEVAGGIRYAPMSWTDGAGAVHPYAADFFPAFHRRMLVAQGINMQTGSHRPGMVNAFQGSFATGFPTLAACFSAARAPSMMMSYLVTGSYRSAGGLLPYTAISRGGLLGSIARPNEVMSLDNGIAPQRTPDHVFEMIAAAREARIGRLLEDPEMMPRRRQMLQRFAGAVHNADMLELLGNILPPDGFQTLDEHSFANTIVQQSDIALHAMAAGLTASADTQLVTSFDSHTDHQSRQDRAFSALVYGLRFLWRRAEEIDARVGSNIADRLTVVIHSEFGRTPYFNADAGTDHWPTTSAIIMRKDFETTGIGSRTVGYSTNDGRYQSGRINPVTLEPDESGGIELTSAHLHKALREYLGIADSPVLARFGFPGVESVNMFTPGLATPQT